MNKILVKLTYESQDPPGFDSDKYLLIKEFQFKTLPIIPCYILVNDPIQYLDFYKPIYNPDNELYIVKMNTSINVSRYYHGNKKEIMNDVIQEFIKHGWVVENQ